MTTLNYEQYVSAVQDYLIDLLGDDFDFYVDQDEIFKERKIEAAINSGVEPSVYAEQCLI